MALAAQNLFNSCRVVHAHLLLFFLDEGIGKIHISCVVSQHEVGTQLSSELLAPLSINVATALLIILLFKFNGKLVASACLLNK